jgi:hypothetical protein
MREELYGQWGGRRADDDPREAARERLLRRELDGSPVVGKPLRERLRNFRPSVESYIASLGGPLPYMQRLRAIEDETREHEQRLAEARRELAAECRGHPDRFARRWREFAHGWRFDAVNELIDRHNRNYPAESRLPMDPRTGDYALVGGEPYRRRPLDAAWILERFPAELAAAA